MASTLDVVLADAAEAARVASAVLPASPVLTEVTEGVAGAGAVAANVEQSIAAHDDTVTTVSNALISAKAAAAPLLASAAPGSTTKVNGIFAAIESLWEDLGEEFETIKTDIKKAV